jgi:predicted nucleic acid-binding protein
LPEIICNTSPIQYRYQLGCLNFLHSLAGRVIVPSAVVDELSAGRSLGIVLPDVSTVDWIDLCRPAKRSALPWDCELGPGETEVLMLALEKPDSVVVLDDGLARWVAKTIGVKLTGTLGILLDAKRAGLVPAVRPLLDQLQELGFRLAPRTRIAVMRLSGELP